MISIQRLCLGSHERLVHAVGVGSLVFTILYTQDKSDADVERLKATVMLCYGYVCHHSPPK